jgi:hypothetical protein
VKLRWLLVAVAACSHNAVPDNSPQLPPETGSAANEDGSATPPAGSATAGSAVATTPPAPPQPPPKQAHDTVITADVPTVKLLSPGSGPRRKLTIASTAGAKQAIDLTIDVGVKQATQDQTLPAVLLHGDVDIPTADKGSAAYKVTVSRVEAKDVTGETRPPQFETVIGGLVSLAITGTVNANGSVGDLTMHHDAADPQTMGLMEQVLAPGLLSPWPVLPADAVGTGAKWEVTTPRKLRDKLTYTETTDYELVAVTAKGFEVRSSTKLTGGEQDVDGAHITGITGAGASSFASATGVFGTSHGDLRLDFNAIVPVQAKDPAAPQTETIPFEFRFTTDVAPH